MLFDVILVLLAVCVALLPFFIRTNTESASEKREISDVLPIPKKKKRNPTVSPQEQKILDILRNIDAYDGTSNGQKPIKEK